MTSSRWPSDQPTIAFIAPCHAHRSANATLPAATYPLLDPEARRRIPEATWVTVHDRCKGTAAGLSYKVGTPTLAGRSAVMSVSLAGVASSLGSEEVTFVYRGGQWLYAPPDLASYGGSAVHIIARLKAAGNCG